MVSESQLVMIRLAFRELSQLEDLEGWGLDPMGWNYNGNQETDDVDLHLLKGESERRAITILPELGATTETLGRQILNQMRVTQLTST